MRVLLTGSSGWLGRYLVPLLAENGHKVIGLDVAPGAYTEVVGAVAGRALRDRTELPFAHDPDYISPIIAQERDACMC
jgi:nucleoside-diphosphate-sugar epimerase